MTRHRAMILGAGACALVAAVALGYGVRVMAEGAPTEQPLFYSGTLEADGAPAQGSYDVALTLFDAASGGNELCGVAAEVQVQNGRFRVDASDCAEAVAAEPDAWVALSFKGSDGVEHSLPDRAKIGAVPYALEAQHAVTASAATGTLASSVRALSDRITALEAASGATPSAFLARKTTPQTIEPPGGKVVLFNDEVFDVGDEYDPGTGIFKAKSAGRYEFTCTVAWDGGSDEGTWEVAIQLNGYEYAFNGWISPGMYMTRHISAVLPLEQGNEVACTALQSLPATALNISGTNYVNFSGRRF